MNKKSNGYVINGNTVTVNDMAGNSFLIDLTDLEMVMQNYWAVNKSTGYAMLVSNGKAQYLHRLITNCPAGMVVDHKNHNRADNRRSNLAIVTYKQNARNRTGRCIRSKTGIENITKVAYKNGSKYLLQLRINDRNVSCGYYDRLIDAAIAKTVVVALAWGNCIETQVIDQICGMTIDIDLTGDNYKLSPEQEAQFVADFDEDFEEPLEKQLKEQLKKLSSEKQLLEKQSETEKSLEEQLLEEPLVVHTDGKITRVADKLSDLIGGNN